MAMATYVTLYRWTEQGIKNVKASPDRITAAKKAVEAQGGKLNNIYVTMGEYDLVAISEWPDEKAAIAFALTLGSQGNVRTTTMRALTQSEFAEIVKKMP
jgi:uncharacterized protein with GYD domain